MSVSAGNGMELTAVLQCLNASAVIVITAHHFPDGDAIGSALALALFLKQQKKNVQVVLPCREIGIAALLPEIKNISDSCSFDFSKQPDLLVCLDCSEPSRICDERFLSWFGKIPVVNIDHHGKVLFGDVNYVLKDCSSTGELIFNLAQIAGWKLEPSAAEALWVALVTDTNRFSTPSTTAATLRCAAELASAGAEAAKINDLIYCQEPWKIVLLRRMVYDSLQLLCQGKVAVASLSVQQFRKTGCVKQDAAEFPLIPFHIQGVLISAFIYAPPDMNEIRISLRSRQGTFLSALQIAEHFGGGGHEHSAAAAVKGTLENAVAEFISFIRQYENTFSHGAVYANGHLE